MLNKTQGQEVAEGSTAIQAGRDVSITQTGLTYADARQVALDVFRANFVELVGIARDTARERAEEITERFLNKLQDENPIGIEKSSDPDFQSSIFTVQKEYARTGDKELGDLLVDLLVDRSKQQGRNLLQIVLNESLSIAPKLTDDQLAALSLVFLFKYTQSYAIGNHQTLGEYFDKNIAPFVMKAPRNLAAYQHLEYSGCAAISIGSSALETILGTTYQGQFLKGFDETEIVKREVSIGADDRVFIHCLNDSSKFQVRANSKEVLDKGLETLGIPNADKPKILELFDLGKMSDVEIRNKCVEIRPYMQNLFETWSNSAMQNLTLTSVGIAIGHANIKRLVGEFANLSVWIN